MHIDLMLALVLLIEALESRMAEMADEAEMRKTRATLNRLDILLEKCLESRFSERDRLADNAEDALKSARKRALRWRKDQEPWSGILGEISDLLGRMDALWVTAGKQH